MHTASANANLAPVLCIVSAIPAMRIRDSNPHAGYEG
jgi:hypothetical protein